MATSIDYGALSQAPTREAVAAFRAAHRGDPGYGGSAAGPWVTLVVGVLVAAFGIGVAGSGGIVGVVVIFGAVIVVLGIVGIVVGARRWPREVRLDGFARTNGLAYYPGASDPSYPGAIFGIGSGRTATDHFFRFAGRALDYGNYAYTTGSGKSRQVHDWWFLALQLDRTLPHMVLDSRANNGLFGATNLPASFARDQVLHLEGDFDRHFTLYCPKEYERDALYILTPDVMAACIDDAAPFDIEIVDRWLLAYAPKHLDMADPAVQQRVWALIDTVGERTIAQSEQYADDRAGGRAAFAANVVAPQGARLRRGVGVAGIVLIVVFAAIVLLPRLFDLFH